MNVSRRTRWQNANGCCWRRIMFRSFWLHWPLRSALAPYGRFAVIDLQATAFVHLQSFDCLPLSAQHECHRAMNNFWVKVRRQSRERECVAYDEKIYHKDMSTSSGMFWMFAIRNKFSVFASWHSICLLCQQQKKVHPKMRSLFKKVNVNSALQLN